MRFTAGTAGLAFLAFAFAFAGTGATAFAAGGGLSAGQVGKGSSEGRGGAGPGGASSGGSASGGSLASGNRTADADVLQKDDMPVKSWEVGGLWETHRLIRQNDLNGAGGDKQFNVFGVYGQYDITEYDRVKLRGFLYERFLSDPGETGFRVDDLILQYTRRIPLPQDFTLRATGWVTAPTSFASQLAGLITAPRVVLDLEKKFGPYVTASVRGYGDAYIAKYSSALGGSPNPKYDLRFGADVEVLMPFHPALSIGGDVATGYTWYYEPNTTGDPNTQVQAYGTEGDSTFATQPITQSYAGEVYVRYTLPAVVGVRTDVLVALANGDASLGSVSVLRDGVGHLNAMYRQKGELYGMLTVRY